MATIRERSGKLIADFRYMGMRCRETTTLEDNLYNRRILKKRLEQLEAEIILGTFEYEKYFPKSKRLEEFKEKSSQQIAVQTNVPLFKDYAHIWFNQRRIEWRGSYQEKIQIVMKKYLIPAFGNQVMTKIKKSDLLNFRASLAKVTHGNDQTSLKASRINQIMTPLRMILNDAAERYEFESPYKNINNLKESKIEVTPFSLEEVHKILTMVRDDFKPYYRSDTSRSEKELIDHFSSFDLLVIDEYGLHDRHEKRLEMVHKILYNRYDNMKSTLLISNFTVQNMQQDLGVRLWSRLHENNLIVVPCYWDDRRIT